MLLTLLAKKVSGKLSDKNQLQGVGIDFLCIGFLVEKLTTCRCCREPGRL